MKLNNVRSSVPSVVRRKSVVGSPVVRKVVNRRRAVAASRKPVATLGHVAGSKPVKRIVTRQPVAVVEDTNTDVLGPFAAELDIRFEDRGHVFVERYEILDENPQHQLIYTTIAELAIEGKDAGYAGGVAHWALCRDLRGKLPADVSPYGLCQELEAAGFLREAHTGKTSLWFLSDIIADRPNAPRTINRGRVGLADGLKSASIARF